MTESKHTPGPWSICWVEEEGVPISFEITDPKHGSARPIVECRWHWKDGRKESSTLSANANLISAAPDLLAACEEFVRKCECGEARSVRSYAQMKAAISKAKGGQQ